ncbi:MAG TPA: hypothetical protein VGN07_12460 [Steroidobacteraceae bacterium]
MTEKKIKQLPIDESVELLANTKRPILTPCCSALGRQMPKLERVAVAGLDSR